MSNVKKIVVITPTYNEAENIEKVVNVLFNAFPNKENLEFHVLVVDGNSPDGTSDIVRNLISEYPRLHLLVEKEKSGLGSAYIKGNDYAFDEIGANYVCQFDADLSHDANKIKDFVKKLEEGYDVVVGTRYRNGGSIPSDWGIHRKILSIAGNLFIRLMYLSNEISDWTGGFRAYTKEVYKDVRDKITKNTGYTSQMSFNREALNRGYKITEVPFDFKDRVKGESKLGADYLFNAFIYVIRTALLDFIKSYFFKVALVGTIGALLQIGSFHILYGLLDLKHLIALGISIEIAITSNFILNNNFSFKDHKIVIDKKLPIKFLKFNLLSVGSVLTQFAINSIGVIVFGETPIVVYTLLVVGILVGLIANYYFYTNFIWKVKKKEK